MPHAYKRCQSSYNHCKSCCENGNRHSCQKCHDFLLGSYYIPFLERNKLDEKNYHTDISFINYLVAIRLYTESMIFIDFVRNKYPDPDLRIKLNLDLLEIDILAHIYKLDPNQKNYEELQEKVENYKKFSGLISVESIIKSSSYHHDPDEHDDHHEHHDDLGHDEEPTHDNFVDTYFRMDTNEQDRIFAYLAERRELNRRR